MTIILHKGEPLNNLCFETVDKARNWLKMNYSKRRFKEDQENVFVCARFGSIFKIKELITVK